MSWLAAVTLRSLSLALSGSSRLTRRAAAVNSVMRRCYVSPLDPCRPGVYGARRGAVSEPFVDDPLWEQQQPVAFCYSLAPRRINTPLSHRWRGSPGREQV
ncbi:hypothetical protein AAFF_G00075440 [Aldrovandia affinis]|uniref:Uncharacterized protein n=1 Tax=Aldrovandia affinis TaxID=143900 RepID=A0AAD7RY30_9TELE|nr:hypothetical protein AAFF_G00075440 [Aldrovandia affinis]